VVGIGFQQEVDHMEQELRRCVAADVFPVRPGDDGHYSKTCAPRRDDLVAGAEGMIAALPRHPAHRVSKIPEIAKGLPLGEIEQGAVAETFGAGGLGPGGGGDQAGKNKK